MNVQIKMPQKLSPVFADAAKRLRPELMLGALEGLALVQKRATANISSKFRARTGRALRSVMIDRPKMTGKKIIGAVGILKSSGKAFYMRFHETGAIIRPKKKKYLIIPQPDGTVRKVKQAILPKRAWLAPAVDRSIKDIKEILVEKINRAFR